jgi:hypothetical protein
MSAEPDSTISRDLEVVRALYEEWERGDVTSSEWADPQIEVLFADGPNPGSWRGLSGLAEGWRDVLNAWEHFRPEVDCYRTLEDGSILVLVRWHGRGKRSGVQVGETGAAGAQLFELVAGKVTRLVTYLDRERALSDLNVSDS